MKVFLLNVVGKSGKTRSLFYADPHLDEHEEGHASAHPPEKGLKGWAIARLRRLQDAWQHPNGRVWIWAHRIWDWLHSRTHPDEMLLARLRSARTIALHHPASIAAEKVHAAWNAFVRRGRKRHWFWFAVNLIISPLTVVLAPLPGPNLIGYWFAYRAVHHWLILVGLSHARRGSVEIVLDPTHELDQPIVLRHESPQRCLDQLSTLDLDQDAVRNFLVRHGFRHIGAVEVQA